MSFVSETIKTWEDLERELFGQQELGEWAYRGQPRDKPLAPTLQRKLENLNIELLHAAAIEKETIRDFERRYPGDDRYKLKNKLYCLGLMQHYGAPTRLLDWTYSPYIAVKFALDNENPAIWCIKTKWCHDTARRIVGAGFGDRDDDKWRRGSGFDKLYMTNDPARERPKFVNFENPYYLNERLNTQQGLFLCAGNISLKFELNLQEMEGWEKKENIVMLKLDFGQKDLEKVAMKLLRMNISSAVLFPGLQGFASSLGERFFHYRDKVT